MSYTVSVEGEESFEIAKECIKSVKFTTEIPIDSNARTKDVGNSLTITGRILTAVDGGEPDGTDRIALWSAVPAENAQCYRKVTVEQVEAGIMERRYCFPHAFVVAYRECFGDDEGTGCFTLVIRQKKDKPAAVTVEGGYSVA